MSVRCSVHSDEDVLFLLGIAVVVEQGLSLGVDTAILQSRYSIRFDSN